jgi:GntR family transcriptional regulator
MPWELNSDKAIYLQLIEIIQHRIISGSYQTNQKLPSVRDLAAEAEVNPNTMQKALAQLERTGLIYTTRTSGKYITEDESMILKTKQTLATKKTTDFLEKMQALGFNAQDTILFLQQAVKEQI